MLMTEQEARAKACPFARAIEGINGPHGAIFGAAVNRSLDNKLPEELQGNPPPCRCIASTCMLWVFAEYRDTGKGGLAPAVKLGGCSVAMGALKGVMG